MILVDSAVWIDHLRHGDPVLTALLDRGGVLTHPFVIGEIALGSLRRRDAILGDLLGLPQTVVASDDEVLQFISRQQLHGRGVGYVDVHLLAAVRLTPGAAFWTRDRQLGAVALELGIGVVPPGN